MWKIHPHPFIRNPRPILFAHRGDSSKIPENTIQAFKDAYQLKVDCIETDVHMTKDENIVHFHDPDLARTTNGTGQIVDYTLAELKEFDSGYKFQPEGSTDFPFRNTGLKIQTTEEILPLFPDIKFNIDIKSKNPKAPEILAQKLKEMDAESRVCIASFHQKQMNLFRTFSKSATSAPPKEVFKFLLKFHRWKRRLSKLHERERKPSTYQDAFLNQKRVFSEELPFYSLQVPMKMYIVNIISPQFIEFAHYVGIAVHVWTINDPAEMERLLRWNVDGIFTDKPGLLIEIWEKSQKTSDV